MKFIHPFAYKRRSVVSHHQSSLIVQATHTMAKFQSVVLSPRDTTISIDDHHVYRVDNLVVHHSVSEFISTLFDPFPRDTVVSNSAKFRKCHTKALNMDQRCNLILSEYKLAAELGSLVHNSIESVLLQQRAEDERCAARMQPDADGGFFETDPMVQQMSMTDVVNNILGSAVFSPSGFDSLLSKSLINPLDGDVTSEFVAVNRDFVERSAIVCMKNFVHAMEILQYPVCATEYMIFDMDRPKTLAGTIDCLLWKDRANREVILVDWKTNKTTSLHFSKKIANTMSPFFNQTLSGLEKYFCQLHTYAKMLEKAYNVRVTDSYIVHVRDNMSIFRATEFKTCPCYTL